MLDFITPLILTYNEAPNIGRALEKLSWARDIVVVDSFSDDETTTIISRFPQVRIFQHKFNSHEAQWNFGLKKTAIETEWVMALDADFSLSQQLVETLRNLRPTDEVKAYRAPFIFCINGSEVHSAICPPAVFLFRRQDVEYIQDGHTQKPKICGRVDTLSDPIFHDDRKPFWRWFRSQKQYARLECEKLISTPKSDLDFADRMRRLRLIAPVAMLSYCLIARGALWEGPSAWLYSVQRMIFELMLSINLLAHDLHIRRLQKVETQFRARLHTRQQSSSEVR
jgi:glycosyltransferase involved in cell wall biosynthesis